MEAALQLLAQEGLPVPETFRAQCRQYLAALRRANPVCSLVSAADLALLEDRHVPDALSLAPLLERHAGSTGMLLDIGSGGGFPAIPLSFVFPARPIVLVERSAKKVGFLQRVVGELCLSQVRVVEAEFPRGVPLEGVRVVTARAVERAEKIQRAVLAHLPEEAVFFSQSGLLSSESALFHVEQVEDAWTAGGLRRGTLHLIRHQHHQS